ncbi:MAG: hypothetical protein JSS99_13655 [Actinobacteria bacterium]|nr:hypothetical protein [Actinomycetota bacterium]
MKALEEIVYEAGRHALADQESLVTAIRQRTGALVAAHALVASFFGASTLSDDGLLTWSWIALASLLVGLVVAAVLLAPWRLRFAVDAHVLYQQLYDEHAPGAASDSPVWLMAAAFAYQKVRDENAPRVHAMSVLSAVLSAVLVLQTLAWVVQLAS